MAAKVVSTALLIAVLACGAGAAQEAQRGETLPRVKVEVPDNLQPLMEKQGFAVRPQRRFSRVAKLYRWWSHKHYPVVITTDAALHTAHLYFEWYQRYLEVAYLHDDLLRLTDALITKTNGYRKEAQGEAETDAATLATCYLLVGKRLLTGKEAGPAPEPYGEQMKRELGLIRGAEGVTVSPLFGYREDYSQYKPRGHYSRSQELSRYFRAMMWFGRMAFRLDGREPERGMQHTRAALVLCRALDEAQVNGESAMDVWRRIYATTSFFAGRSDDLLPTDYRTLLEQGDYDTTNEEDIRRFIEAAQERSDTRIAGTPEPSPETAGGPDWRQSTAGLRLFGRRYSPDAEVMQTLTFDSVGEYQGDRSGDLPFTCVNARGMLIRGFPRGLDVMAALGFVRARKLLNEAGDDNYERYEQKRIEAGGIMNLSGAAVFSSLMPRGLPAERLLALNWLQVHVRGEKPRAMSSENWPLKQLAAALGSWTELKHDTILYSKQPYSMMQMALAGASKGGPAPPEPPPPHGYVEPHPNLYSTLAEGVRGLRGRISGLGYPEDRALLTRLDNFVDTLDRLKEISEKELQGETLSPEEYRFIEHIGHALRIPAGGFPHNRDVDSEFRTEMDDVMPIVADVHTDPNSGKVLEQAVGYPMALYMECPVDGKPTVCLGATYSYYEFKQPLSERLTDEEWREMLAKREAPPMPEWMKAYVIPE